MQKDACKFTGSHRYELSVVENCRSCGHTRRRSKTSCMALGLIPAALWTNAILLIAVLTH